MSRCCCGALRPLVLAPCASALFPCQFSCRIRNPRLLAKTVVKGSQHQKQGMKKYRVNQMYPGGGAKPGCNDSGKSAMPRAVKTPRTSLTGGANPGGAENPPGGPKPAVRGREGGFNLCADCVSQERREDLTWRGTAKGLRWCTHLRRSRHTAHATTGGSSLARAWSQAGLGLVFGCWWRTFNGDGHHRLASQDDQPQCTFDLNWSFVEFAVRVESGVTKQTHRSAIQALHARLLVGGETPLLTSS